MAHLIRTPVLAIAIASMVAQPVLAQQPPAQAADIVVNMRGVEISDVAEQISRLTGRTLILDPAVKGVVTVTSAQPLSPAGVWELFQSVLRANGFAAVRSGRAWRIVPAGNAVRDGGVPSRGASGQQLVTRMIRLQNIPAAEAARVVRPLVATFGSVEPVPAPSNAIVVTDYADNVRRIEGIARQLDGGGGSTFATIQLRHGNAADVAAALTTVLGDGATAGARVAGDARSNTIIVRGTPTAVAEARRMALALDTAGGGTPMTRVFRLSYGDAESVTRVLRGVLGQESSANNPVARSLSSNATNPLTGRALQQSPLTALAQANPNAVGTAAAANANATAPAAGANAGPQQTGQEQGFATPDLVVQPAPDINAIVVRGTPSAIAAIEPIIADLDVRRPQVLIEAAIAEIVGDDAEQLAVQLGTSGAVLNQVEGAGTSFTNAGPSLGQILTVLGVPAASILGSGLTGNVAIGNDFSILVQALGQSTRANLLSTPQVTVIDNDIGEIVVGQNVPFRTGSFTTDGNTVNPFTTIERQDVGITLKVIPRVNAGDTVRLQVSQEVSSLLNGLVPGASDLVTNRRQINTTVLADNGQTIVLGGLITDDRTQTRSQVPILGDIPIIGELFRGRRETQTKRTLFIFLKPTILRTSADAEAAARARYQRLRAAELDNRRPSSLLLSPPKPRLTMEIEGVY